jgi:(4S)-4-hydroxy-5-phosphonooxypentane-2,3-dione isomerase
MHVVLVQITVRSEMLDEFAEALLRNARESVAGEPGCLRFDVSQVKDDPLTWVLHEVYDREESHAAHRQTAHFAAFNEVLGRAMKGRTVLRCDARHIT